MTLRSMAVEVEHKCEFSGDVDCDICAACKEHSSFCETCGTSECCGLGSIDTDRDMDMER